MCFSATASFIAGGLLVSAGLWGARIAYRQKKAYVLFALIPFFFGIQQISEGFVWIFMNSNRPYSAYVMGYVYLFYAFYFWPVYVPLSVYWIEKKERRRKLLQLFTIGGFILGSILYMPLVLQIVSYTVSLVQHSIDYKVYQPGLRMWIYSVTYVFIITVSLISSSQLKIKIFGILAFLSSVAAYYIHVYTFTSMWCFFAAILSVYILFILINSPKLARSDR